jgi:hypothetical protein
VCAGAGAGGRLVGERSGGHAPRNRRHSAVGPSPGFLRLLSCTLQLTVQPVLANLSGLYYGTRKLSSSRFVAAESVQNRERRTESSEGLARARIEGTVELQSRFGGSDSSLFFGCQRKALFMCQRFRVLSIGSTFGNQVDQGVEVHA